MPACVCVDSRQNPATGFAPLSQPIAWIVPFPPRAYEFAYYMLRTHDKVAQIEWNIAI